VSVREKIAKGNVREKGKETDGERDVVHAIDHRNDLVTDVRMVETDPVHPCPAITGNALHLETLASTQKIISITQSRGILTRNNPELSPVVHPLFY
jgi:hypothetical protein